MKVLGELVGKRLISVEAWDGSPCVLQFEDNYRAFVDSLWRLADDKSILLTSEDDRQTYGLEIAIDAIAELGGKLRGLQIEQATAEAITGDLSLAFVGSNLKFQVISSSSGFEAWQVYRGTDIRYVTVGGGQVREWP